MSDSESAMRICLLTNQDLDSPTIKEDDWPADPRPFLPEAEWTLAVLEKSTAVQQVLALSRQNFDLYFNLCDGAWDEDTPGIEVVHTLERLDVPYTGATPHFYEPTREAMKRVCRAWDIDAPAYVAARNDFDVQRAAETLRFPLIVKHPSSYASLDMTRDSRVETPEALFEQANLLLAKYAGALIEEFIEGRECTVLVAENPDDSKRPTTYTPIEYRFPEGESFKHSEMKWVIYREMESFPVVDPALSHQLRDVSARFFRGLNGTGYGRCDLRVDADGRAFMLEINANCGVYFAPEDAGSADFCLLNDPAGHEGFTRQVVRAAFQRHASRARAWEGRPGNNGEHGLYATRSLQPGDTILRFEEQPHELVTRSHVERHWGERQRAWFRSFAWPLTDEVWVMWSKEPDEWKAVNHSCEPTAWLEGLDVVARLPLERGNEITLDYATFYNEQMPAFECQCGASACRRTIRGDDYLQDFVDRYGEHVSDYVRRKRSELALRPQRAVS